MRNRPAINGFSSLDVFAMIVVALSIGLMAGVVAGRSFRADHLVDAVRTVEADVERVRQTAMRTGGGAELRRISNESYVAGGVRRTLPGRVRFDPASARTLSFTMWGTLATGGSERLVLVAPDGRRRAISIRPSGELARR